MRNTLQIGGMEIRLSQGELLCESIPSLWRCTVTACSQNYPQYPRLVDSLLGQRRRYRNGDVVQRTVLQGWMFTR
jgi:hypothetical protein